MKALLLLGPALLLAASAVSAQETPKPAVPGVGEPQGACRAEGLGRFEGKAADDATVAEAKAASGAKVVRVIPFGAMVTMDFSPDRLNIELDKAGRISRLRCG